MKKVIFLMALFLSENLPAQKQIAVEDFTTRNTFNQRSITGINWMSNGKFYTSINDNKIIKYDITTGQAVETIVDGGQLPENITIEGYSLSADEKKILLTTHTESIYRRSYTAEYYIYDLATKALKKLSSGGPQSYATFSPDGSHVAFVRNNNLFYTNLADSKETSVTTDGQFNQIINGSTDWVYEEELSFAKAFFWSPDGKKIAYYRFDESRVKEYNMQKWNKGQLYPQDYRYKYPKAGEDNSIVDIWFYDLATQQKVKGDLGTEKDIYIPRVDWTNDPGLLSVRRMNRLQNTMELLHINASTGQSTVVIAEKSETYYDIDYTDELIYLKNSKQFLISSERSGYKHIYLYDINGTLVRPITQGDWEVAQVIGFDETGKNLYYLSTEGNYLDRTFYSVSLDGKKKSKLSTTAGAHSVSMSNDFQFYIDYANSATQPLMVSLYKTKGNTLVKVLENNEAFVKTTEEYGIVAKEYFQYTAADGTTKVDGYLLKPKDFNSAKKYPVLVYQYSGPRSTNTTNSYGGASFWWHQMLTQKGIIVAVIDTRGNGSRGEQFAKQTYKQLGKLETEDLVAGGKYLGSLPYVDKNRLAIWGWSFGGYTTSLVMTKGAGTYKVGIAGAPVTSWRYYDNIYTERFLQRPQDNAKGYDENSPMLYADKLQGDFLLIHGTGDDNVHFQNSVALEEALINAGKQFRSHFYPDQPHGFRGGKVNHHRYTLMTNFLLEHL
jgi:dipeptidyl-peptidase 4